MLLCDADNLATTSLTFTSTHTNCLIQLLKSVSIKPFVSTEAAHSTAAFLTVKLFFENLFSTQPLAASINLHLSSAGGESYSVQNHCQPPLSTAFDQPDRSHQQDSTTTLPARRILLESATSATLLFSQPFDLQEVLLEDCAGSGAHYRHLKTAVNRLFRLCGN